MLFEESKEMSQIERIMCLYGPDCGIRYGGRCWCGSGTYYPLLDKEGVITELETLILVQFSHVFQFSLHLSSSKHMAGKCCKSENSSGGCPAMASSESGCCKKKSSSCCVADALGLPKCVVMTAAAVALVGVSAALTINYMKRK
jgi:hypothetical protein